MVRGSAFQAEKMRTKAIGWDKLDLSDGQREEGLNMSLERKAGVRFFRSLEVR